MDAQEKELATKTEAAAAVERLGLRGFEVGGLGAAVGDGHGENETPEEMGEASHAARLPFMRPDRNVR